MDIIDEDQPDHPIEVGAPIRPTLVERQREETREKLALFLVIALTLITILSLGLGVGFPDRVSAIKEILTMTLPGFFGAFGTAVGFYFGQKMITRRG